MTYNLDDYRRRQEDWGAGRDDPGLSGADLHDPAPDGLVSCCKCGKGIPEDETTCMHCGIHFNGGTAYDFAPETGRRGQRRRMWVWVTWVMIVALLLSSGLLCAMMVR